MVKEKFISFTWSDGRYFDLWSIVHFLSGVFCGPAFVLIGVSLWPGLVIVLAAAIIYEYLEYLWGVSEDWRNLMADIVLAIVGCAVYLLLFRDQSSAFHWTVFTVDGMVNSILTYIGYLNYRRRTGK